MGPGQGKEKGEGKAAEFVQNKIGMEKVRESEGIQGLSPGHFDEKPILLVLVLVLALALSGKV